MTLSGSVAQGGNERIGKTFRYIYNAYIFCWWYGFWSVDDDDERAYGIFLGGLMVFWRKIFLLELAENDEALDRIGE